MDIKKDLPYIEKSDKFCSCDYLVRLSYLDKKKKALQNLCNDLEESLEGIHKNNFEVKELYYKKIYEFVNFCKEHHTELNSLIKKEKLKLFYHNEKEDYNKQSVNQDKAMELLKEKKMVTAHCYSCNQQIYLIS